ncbi:MAG TPA: tetratricopeptide repeat protein [Chloroflexota bacterium]|nr:tetratricopeptide repeat protein [Chloroflexota bacterium]
MASDYSGAADDFTEALRLNPDYTDAYLARGEARRALEDYDGALADFTQALTIRPDLTTAYVYRGIVLAQLMDLHGAIDDFTQALQLAPSLAEANVLRGEARMALLALPEAVVDFQVALQARPDLAEAHASLGGAYVMQGNFDAAMPELDGAVELSPTTAWVYRARGAAYMAQGDAAIAIQDFSRAIQRAPEFAALYVDRGLARNRLGDTTAAAEDVQRAVDLYQAQGNAIGHQTALGALRLIRDRPPAGTAESAPAVSATDALTPAGVREQFFAARNHGDVAAMLALFTDDAVLEGVPGTRAVGRPAIQQVLETDAVSGTRITVLDAQVAGNAETGHYEDRADAVQASGADRIRGSYRLETRDGRIALYHEEADFSDPQTVQYLRAGMRVVMPPTSQDTR